MFGNVVNAPTASIITLASLNRSSSASVMLIFVSLAISSPVDVSIVSFVVCAIRRELFCNLCMAFLDAVDVFYTPSVCHIAR